METTPPTEGEGTVVVVDAANVVGSRPDGWWRDRAGAAARLVASIRSAVLAQEVDGPVTVVLEGEARSGVEAGHDEGVEVVHAPGEGDDTIVEVVRGLDGGAVVVTADRGLAQRVEHLGAAVVGPRWLYRRLAD